MLNTACRLDSPGLHVGMAGGLFNCDNRLLDGTVLKHAFGLDSLSWMLEWWDFCATETISLVGTMLKTASCLDLLGLDVGKVGDLCNSDNLVKYVGSLDFTCFGDMAC